MGQKVNPVGFRLGTSRDHDSVWYAKSKDYSKLVLEDIKVRERIKEIIPQAPISSVSIKRTMEEIIVDINTSRPGIVIGKKGEEIEKIKHLGKPVIFISGHFNNFELMAMHIEKSGIDLAAIYRPLMHSALKWARISNR